MLFLAARFVEGEIALQSLNLYEDTASRRERVIFQVITYSH
jgi:hypothetical protein